MLIAICAAGGLTASTLYGVQFRTSSYAASDFKTLYASVWCFAHRMDAYSIANLQRVFLTNGVMQPERWYGHAPVYPFTTLAALIPIATVGMVPAMYAMTIVSGALWAIATFILMRYTAASFELGVGWRMVVAGLCACGPLLSFGLGVGNVSIAVSALCFLAFACRNQANEWTHGCMRWIAGASLALAFLLKPHLALWVGIGMLLLPERAGRAVVARAAALVAGFTAVTAIALAVLGTLVLEIRSYLAILSAETSAGASMNATSREVLPVVAQITSLESIVGFWIVNHGVRIGLTAAALLGLGYLTFRKTRRVESERGALLAVGAWCVLGMLATYHRAHDAVLLLIFAPWVVDRMRKTPLAWIVALLYAAMSTSADFPVVVRWVAGASKYSLVDFVLLRQVGLADLLLLPVVLLAMQRERASHRALEHAESMQADELQAAA